MKLEKKYKIERMNLGKVWVLILCLALGFLSCSKSEDDDTIDIIPPRDRAEQQILDNDSIIDYLESHYYNSDDFLSNPDPSILDIVITKLADGETVPVGNKLLKDAVETKTVTYQNTIYDFYVLKLNQGGGDDSPTFADEVLVNYEGFTLKDVVFDNVVTPVTFKLPSLIPGWRKVLPDFNVAESFLDTNDGTVDFVNHGVGVMFIPSGLGYFDSAQTNIPAYSPIVFKFELLQMYENDLDDDGIPSYLEDLNGDGEFIVNFDDATDSTDDDTDGDFNPNFADADDDGDRVLTKDEIEITTVNKPTREEVLAISLESDQVLLNKIIKEQNGTFTGTVLTFIDTDSDGTPDYLDAN